jgi:hypothetical protein
LNLKEGRIYAAENESLSRGTGLLLFASMLGELMFQILGSAAHPFQHFQRNPEFAIARSADCDGGSGSKPLHYTQITLWHESEVRIVRNAF